MYGHQVTAQGVQATMVHDDSPPAGGFGAALDADAPSFAAPPSPLNTVGLAGEEGVSELAAHSSPPLQHLSPQAMQLLDMSTFAAQN